MKARSNHSDDGELERAAARHRIRGDISGGMDHLARVLAGVLRRKSAGANGEDSRESGNPVGKTKSAHTTFTGVPSCCVRMRPRSSSRVSPVLSKIKAWRSSNQASL